jgi:hypothetical protein
MSQIFQDATQPKPLPGGIESRPWARRRGAIPKTGLDARSSILQARERSRQRCTAQRAASATGDLIDRVATRSVAGGCGTGGRFRDRDAVGKRLSATCVKLGGEKGSAHSSNRCCSQIVFEVARVVG